jgi:broad specificity phosphatase PhoE
VRRKRTATVAIVFETHSSTVDAGRWIATGWRDARLSTAGKRQAAELGERRADEKIAAVFSSDLSHATETARIAFASRGIPILNDWRLRECDLGELTGRPVAEFEQARDRFVYDPFPGGESYVDVVARVRSFVADLAPRFADRRIVVVGHQGTKIALDHVLEGTSLADLVSAPFRWQPGWTYALAVDA